MHWMCSIRDDYQMPNDSDSVNLRIVITNESAVTAFKLVGCLLEELAEEFPWREDVGKGLAAAIHAAENLKPRMVSEERLDKLPFALSYSKETGWFYIIVNDRPHRPSTETVYREGDVQILMKRDSDGSLACIEIRGIEVKEE